MWVAARWRMRRFLAALALVLVTGAMAHGLTLESPRIQATLMLTSSKDPFRIRGRLAGVDLATVVDGPVTVRFGDQWARVSAGQFRRRGNSVFTWKSYLYGVKKVTINTKKATIDVVGGGVELGELPGPVTLAIGTSAGAVCGEAVWEPVAPPRPRRPTRNPIHPARSPMRGAASTPANPNTREGCRSGPHGTSASTPAVAPKLERPAWRSPSATSAPPARRSGAGSEVSIP